MSDLNSVTNKYSHLLSHVNQFLKTWNFSRAGNLFKRRCGDTIEMIQFQKSMSSNSAKIKFTINLGISPLDKGNKKSNTFYDCHEQKRVGFLMSEKKDIWFLLDGETNVDNLKNTIINIIENCVFNYFVEQKENQEI